MGESLVRYLANAYPSDLGGEFPCTFRVVSSNEINDSNQDFDTSVTLFLHRVTLDPHTRNTSDRVGPLESRVPVSLNLHYLLTIWANSPVAEQTILGWVIRELYQHEALSQSDLTPNGGWGSDDVVQVIPGEISNEDMMRIWDALDPAYRLSLSYVARVVRIDPAVAVAEGPPVVARRFAYRERVRAE